MKIKFQKWWDKHQRSIAFLPSIDYYSGFGRTGIVFGWLIWRLQIWYKYD